MCLITCEPCHKNEKNALGYQHFSLQNSYFPFGNPWKVVMKVSHGFVDPDSFHVIL